MDNAPDQLSAVGLDRRQLLGAALAAGLGGLWLAGCGSSGEEPPFTPLFAEWVRSLHPAITTVDREFRQTRRLRLSPAPRGGVDVADFINDAKHEKSHWDAYVGLTPFAELTRLVDFGAIEPYDAYVTPSALSGIGAKARQECSLNGRLYSWPLFLDLVVQGWNAEIVERAGLDPSRPPVSWDDFVENARRVVSSGAAPYGCTFDARPWRSLVPITYSISTAVYTDDGLFDLRHEATVEALEVLRRLKEVANPDALDPSTTAGVGATPDEGAFAAQTAAYYLKYQNALVRMAALWPDPRRLSLGRLPRHPGGEGSTVFWTTGMALLRFGHNKRAAAAYATALTNAEQLWKQSLAGGRQAAGHLPVHTALWEQWHRDGATWVPAWATETHRQLRVAQPIRPHTLGATQFTIAQPYVNQYLSGEVSSARAALRSAMARVQRAAKS
jgi:ABC-type glycerol-3-phosphate transport system substrate-binding protein